MAKKLTDFKSSLGNQKVSYIESQTVKEGVECDIYMFNDDPSKDLAIVYVQPGHKTPRQKVLLGNKTIDGFIEGSGKLTVWSIEGATHTYNFDSSGTQDEVIVKVGETMQWAADEDATLTFYEICEPPYEDGRFENVTT